MCTIFNFFSCNMRFITKHVYSITQKSESLSHKKSSLVNREQSVAIMHTYAVQFLKFGVLLVQELTKPFF